MAHEYPSPETMLPRIRAWEWHDLESTPYFFRYMLTRLLEVAWTTDFSKYSFFRMYHALMNVFVSKYSRTELRSLRSSDLIAELIFEVAFLMNDEGAADGSDGKKSKQNKKKAAAAAAANGDSNTFRVLDMCSGAGGPTVAAAHEIANRFAQTNQKTYHVTLSDLVPHPQHWLPHQIKKDNLVIDFVPSSVDATRVDPAVFASGSSALWTIMASFHHFDNSLAKSILRAAVNHDGCSGILIIELSEHRTYSAFVLTVVVFIMAFFAPLYALPPVGEIFSSVKKLWFAIQVLCATPFFWFPACWDTIVSCTRTLTSQELLRLAQEADVEGKMEWHAAVRPLVPGWGPGFGSPPGLVYLRGIKKST